MSDSMNDCYNDRSCYIKSNTMIRKRKKKTDLILKTKNIGVLFAQHCYNHPDEVQTGYNNGLDEGINAACKEFSKRIEWMIQDHEQRIELLVKTLGFLNWNVWDNFNLTKDIESEYEFIMLLQMIGDFK